ncbi:hypothetical protein PSQ19_18435 [Devosia algicola]|uniref:Uncharacterized protein n=1 Tax=Devosia algicola TaxID=3026418 RepID=A0ABY7YMN1_9HYPH|nr:hypothetical protein [Devosia algicola]WDR02538.1 hypothetical protein PSQ19_18435 [Devosia algicola]
MDVSRQIAGFMIGALCTMVPMATAQGAETDLPTLTVEGTISGSPGSVVFDRDQLEAIGMVSVKTSTPWNEGVVDFEGVPMTRLLEAAGVSGESRHRYRPERL